jgi:hypothetical protein
MSAFLCSTRFQMYVYFKNIHSDTNYCRHNSKTGNCFSVRDHKFFSNHHPDRQKSAEAECFAAGDN